MQHNETRAIISRIRRNNKQYAMSILGLGFRTLLIPVLALVLFALLSALVIDRVQTLTGSQIASFVASGVSFIVTVLAARFAWRWADARYGGWTLLRTVGEVNSEVRSLERGGAAEYMAAQAVWETYRDVMQAAGFALE